MTPADPTRLTAVLAELRDHVEDASPRLRSRKEWKAADSFERQHGEADDPDGEALDDLIREAEAQRDLLAIARTESEQALADEERVRQSRLTEDEALLAHLQTELKVFGGFILATFLLPPALFAPLGPWIGLGAVPAVLGMARMSGVSGKVKGRRWLILKDRVDEVEKKIRFAHGIALASVGLTALWVVFAMLASQAQG